MTDNTKNFNRDHRKITTTKNRKTKC